MGYYIDEASTSLDNLQTRLETTDLIPSQKALLPELTKKMDALKKTGIKSIAGLRTRLKSKKSLASLADDSGINPDYLAMLRRAVEGFFPKPQALKTFDWLDQDTITRLDQAGVRNTRQLYEATSSGVDKLVDNAGLKKKNLLDFLSLSDLSRIQWVSPTFARALAAAGFTRTTMVAAANPETLYEALMKVNENAHFYKGKVGLRDIKRLIAAAAYVPVG